MTTKSERAKAPPTGLSSREDNRREPRYLYEFSIEVSGFDHAGRFFTETTSTLDASFCGCKFRLRAPVEKGSVVAIRLLNTENRPQIDRATLLFQAVHVTQETRGWTIGAWKLQSSNAWSAEFAAAQESANAGS